MIDVVIFGTGQYYNRYKNKLMNNDINIKAYIDNDVAKWNMRLDGAEIVSPQLINELQYDYIIIMSAYSCDMKKQLLELNVDENKIYYIGNFLQLIDKSIVVKKENSVFSKNKILLFVSPLIFDGGSNVACCLANILAFNGWEVHIVTPYADERVIKKLDNAAIKIIENPSIPYGKLDFLNLDEYKLVLVNLFKYIKLAIDLAESKKVILWLHDPVSVYDNVIVEFGNYINKELLKKIKIYAVSEIAKRNFQKYYDIKNIDILTCGIKDDYNNTCHNCYKNRLVLAIIGTICTLKGQKTLVNAVKKLSSEEKKKIDVYIIGRNDFNAYSNSLLKEIKQIEYISYLGEYTSEQMKRIYKKIDVVICASEEETLSLTTIEGMMMKKVCITSSNTGIAKYIEEYKNGLIFEANNYEDLSKKISWILNNINLLEGIGINARQTYEKYFSLKTFEQNVLNIVNLNNKE